MEKPNYLDVTVKLVVLVSSVKIVMAVRRPTARRNSVQNLAGSFVTSLHDDAYVEFGTFCVVVPVSYYRIMTQEFQLKG